MTSADLRLLGPRIGYARLVVPRYSSNQSQGMDISKVINLGHTSKQPLMYRASELVDGLEPHGTIPQVAAAGMHVNGGTGVYGEGVPGVGLGGYWEGSIPGTHLRPVLRLI